MKPEFHHHTALITGASSGIGAAVAHALAARGASLVLVARRAMELKRVEREIRSSASESTAEIHCIPADVTAAMDRQRIRDFLEQKQLPLHILINNAGITSHARFDETQSDVLRRTMEINFFAAVELTAQMLPLLKKSARPTGGRKSIVLVSTPSGLYGIPGRFAYSASKAAGHVWMEAMRQELKADQIQCNIICPGYTRTALRQSGLDGQGNTIQEEQAKEAKSPHYMAVQIINGIIKNKRLLLTDTNGRFVYWLRTLAPGLLERIMAKKLAKDLRGSVE
ncbi:MAG: SDR family NAD(P)-dependent oxidoreductase [Leptospiraceae bacterium]|nr:SDR family NAD(P)-dependent oxidoreductase [Leptospiraceae bacterium]